MPTDAECYFSKEDFQLFLQRKKETKKVVIQIQDSPKPITDNNNSPLGFELEINTHSSNFDLVKSLDDIKENSSSQMDLQLAEEEFELLQSVDNMLPEDGNENHKQNGKNKELDDMDFEMTEDNPETKFKKIKKKNDDDDSEPSIENIDEPEKDQVVTNIEEDDTEDPQIDQEEDSPPKPKKKKSNPFAEEEAGIGFSDDDDVIPEGQKDQDDIFALYGDSKQTKKNKKKKNLEAIGSDDEEELAECQDCGREEIMYCCKTCEIPALCKRCPKKKHVGHDLEYIGDKYHEGVVEDDYLSPDEGSENAPIIPEEPQRSSKEWIEHDDMDAVGNFASMLNKRVEAEKRMKELNLVDSDHESDRPSKKLKQVLDAKAESEKLESYNKIGRSKKENIAQINKVREIEKKYEEIQNHVDENTNMLSDEFVSGFYSAMEKEIISNYSGYVSQTDFKFLVKYILSIAFDTITKPKDDRLILKLISDESAVFQERQFKQQIKEFYENTERKIKGFYSYVFNEYIHGKNLSYDKMHLIGNTNKTEFISRGYAKSILVPYGWIITAWRIKKRDCTITKPGARCCVTGSPIEVGEEAYQVTLFSVFDTQKKNSNGKVEKVKKKEATWWLVKKYPKPEHPDLYLKCIYAIWNLRRIGSTIKLKIKKWMIKTEKKLNPKDPPLMVPSEQQGEPPIATPEGVFPLLNMFIDDKKTMQEIVQHYAMLVKLVKDICSFKNN
jgi:hypothetical protein